MTDEQHTKMGAILGYPPCCVAAWVGAPTDAAVRRGSVSETRRAPEESARLDKEITALLGRTWTGASRDPYKRYVPCSRCAS